MRLCEVKRCSQQKFCGRVKKLQEQFHLVFLKDELESLSFELLRDSLAQGSPTFLKLRATSCVSIKEKGYELDTHL